MRYRYKDTANGCVGSLDIPTTAGALTVHAVGDDRVDALTKAALIAERIASDPVLRAIMPPQAAVAIKAAKGLAAAARRGPRVLRHFWGRIHGEGKKRLAEALHSEVSDVGWNPFRRKRKRRPMRRRMPPMPSTEPEDMEPEPELPPEMTTETETPTEE